MIKVLIEDRRVKSARYETEEKMRDNSTVRPDDGKKIVKSDDECEPTLEALLYNFLD